MPDSIQFNCRNVIPANYKSEITSENSILVVPEILKSPEIYVTS